MFIVCSVPAACSRHDIALWLWVPSFDGDDSGVRGESATPLIPRQVEPRRRSRDQLPGCCRRRGSQDIMKIALLALLGLAFGTLGGAALGIGAGLAWIELF